ncbi:hypothetical protein ACJX0J_039346, partial [Zea mays]
KEDHLFEELCEEDGDVTGPPPSTSVAGIGVEFHMTLQIITEYEGISQEAIEEYKKRFTHPLSQCHIEALQGAAKRNMHYYYHLLETLGMPSFDLTDLEAPISEHEAYHKLNMMVDLEGSDIILQLQHFQPFVYFWDLSPYLDFMESKEEGGKALGRFESIFNMKYIFLFEYRHHISNIFCSSIEIIIEQEGKMNNTDMHMIELAE